MPSQPQQHLSSIPLQLHLTEEARYQRVSRNAFELSQLRGEEPGHDLDDWLAAERLVQQELRQGLPVPNPILKDDAITEDDEVRNGMP